MRVAAKDERGTHRLPRSFDQAHAQALGHKLVYVVVVTVVEAVDVVQLAVPARPLAIAYPTLGEARHVDAIGIHTVAVYLPGPPFGAVSGRNHTETWAGCIVSFTTPTRSPFRASRSVSSRSLAAKASRVFLASYLLR
jgi:hypothetical protein